jgi:hypothetical protein
MNGERFVGICREFAARLNEAWGELSEDPLRVAAGRHGRVVATKQQRRGIENEQSARQLKDFLHRNRNWYFSEEP